MSLLKGWKFQLGEVPGDESMLAVRRDGELVQGGWDRVVRVASLELGLGSCPIIKCPFELGRVFHLVPFLLSSGHCQSLHEKLAGRDVMVKWTRVAEG